MRHSDKRAVELQHVKSVESPIFTRWRKRRDLSAVLFQQKSKVLLDVRTADVAFRVTHFV